MVLRGGNILLSIIYRIKKLMIDIPFTSETAIKMKNAMNVILFEARALVDYWRRIAESS